MDFKNLIIECLGLQDVDVEKYTTDQNNLKLTLTVRQKREHCRCHHCDSPLEYVREWKERRIRGPAMGGFLYVEIILWQLRATCSICMDRVRSAAVPFVHPFFQNLTLSLCELAGRWMEELPCAAVARFFNLNSKTMWDLDQVRMKMMKPLIEFPSEISFVKMSADEVHFRTMPKVDSSTRPEIKFVTNLVCYSESKVLANAPGRSEESLLECLNVLSPEQRDQIQYFSVDMHDAFISTIQKLCPKAQICIDRFHLAQKVNETFDDLRKSEFRLAEKNKDNFQMGMLAPHRRFVLVEREKKLNKSDLKMLEQLKAVNKNILNGMILVEHFHAVLDKNDLQEFRKSLTLWYRLVRESGVEHFKKLARLIKKNRRYIEAYILSGLTTAKSEGLNNKIKVMRRSGYGYTNENSYMNKILQRCGYLNSRFVRTSGWFWQLPADLAQNTPF
jgi:transposase